MTRIEGLRAQGDHSAVAQLVGERYNAMSESGEVRRLEREEAREVWRVVLSGAAERGARLAARRMGRWRRTDGVDPAWVACPVLPGA